MLSKMIQHIILVMFAHYKYLSHAFESPEIEIEIKISPILDDSSMGLLLIK
jgi:hypothetical protein